MALEVTRFFEEFVGHQSSSPASPPQQKPTKAAGTGHSPALKFFNVTTNDISLELSDTSQDDSLKVMFGMSGNKGSIRMKYDEQGRPTLRAIFVYTSLKKRRFEKVESSKLRPKGVLGR